MNTDVFRINGDFYLKCEYERDKWFLGIFGKNFLGRGGVFGRVLGGMRACTVSTRKTLIELISLAVFLAFPRTLVWPYFKNHFINS